MHDRGLRELFLTSEWVRYPSVKDLKFAGRVLSVDRLGLKVFCGGQASGGQFKRLSKSSVKNWSQISLLLIPGDIVGVRKNGYCILLTPWRSAERSEFFVADADRVRAKLLRQQEWNRFLLGVNQFFLKNGFLSVSTPSLVDNPGPEPTIDVFKTVYKCGRERTDKFLITSPELHLKKILAQTLTPVYEITKVYRNNEHSPKHQPEFWMIEWYRPFSDLDAIVEDVKKLILFLIKHLGLKRKTPRFEYVSFESVLKNEYKYAFTPSSTADDLKRLLRQQSIYFSDSMNLDDLFTLVNLELVESNINPDKIVFLNQYPPYAAALAKLDESGWAQRFEVYWQGLELGNAFNELNDPDIQEQRLREDNIKKVANGLDPLPIDTQFLESLKRGLPPAAGIAVGLERLFMALYNETDITQLKWF